MNLKRKIIEIDEERCDGCGQCVTGCAEGALEIVDGKAKVISDNLCDGLGACIGECPQEALRIIERQAVPFDEEAVDIHLSAQKIATARREKTSMPCGCPSTQIQSFAPTPAAQITARPAAGQASALSHWPVQIRLIPPTAPFLKGADVLITADCVPAACATFHQELLRGKVLMLGCPKFDDGDAYIERFAAIFESAGIKSITTVFMEVPCCSALPMMVKKGWQKSGRDIPMTEIVVSTRGQIIEERLVT